MTVDDVLARIRVHLDLEAETEYEVLEEIRAHLEEAVEEVHQLDSLEKLKTTALFLPELIYL